jgi:integrase
MKTLKPRAVEALPEGVHRIDRGIYVKRTDGANGTSRTVLLRYSDGGRQKVLSLGPWSADRYGALLAKGRELRNTRAAGKDPRNARDLGNAPDTFRAAAEAFIVRKASQFTSAEHLLNYRTSLEALYPVLGSIRITDLEVGHIVRALSPLWLRVPTTARRVRQRVEKVIDSALAQLDPTRVNPASWRLLQHLLPGQPKRTARNFKAMPHAQVPAFYASLPGYESATGTAMRLLILTSCRTNEVLGMQWDEVDFKEAVWTIPAGRAKVRKPWRIALGSHALAILRQQRRHKISPYVFPGRDEGKPLQGDALYSRMKLAGVAGDATVHGFRSSFKDWCREQTQVSWELVELALSHEIGNAVERRYGRSDLLSLRRPLAEAWGEFVAGEPVALKVMHRKVA